MTSRFTPLAAVIAFAMAIAAELSWRAYAPIAGGPRLPRPPARLVLALSALFASAIAVVAFSLHPAFAEVPRTTWEGCLLAWMAALLWVGVKLFEALTSGAIHRRLRTVATILSAVFSLLLIVGFVDMTRMWLGSHSTMVLTVLSVNAAAIIALIVRWRVPAIAGGADHLR